MKSVVDIDADIFRTELEEFVIGLLSFVGVNHAGNCLVMSKLLQEFVGIFYDLKTKIINVNVKGVNHYCLQLKNKTIIDGTASQFEGMPKVYIGEKPEFYVYVK